MDSLAKPAVEAVKTGKIKFVPERFTKIYCNWLDNIRDWCISRQLWWGHRIPAWYCDDCGETIVSRTDIDVCPKCGSKHLHQDEDVLDTWFSSGLWPFETMGWPEETPELKQFYPTSTLVTGYDIIFFWVARMVMMGLEFGKDIPFKTVYIHGLVRDEQGRKMSKSLGNGIDPVEVIDQYGADTLRFMLITGNTPGNDMRFINDRVVATRNFANKLWNASRFMLMNLEGFDKSFVPAAEDYTLADKWIMSRYAKTAQGVTANLEKFELGEAGRLIYEFIWNEFCDWYIELAKARLYDKENLRPRQTAQYVLGYVLDGTWRLLMPELGTPLKNKPTMPLTALQKRWLKTLLLDEKISLFFSDEEIARQRAALQSVEPLYRPEQFVFFDRFVDGDAYTNPKYRANFREILHAVREKRYLNASYRSNRGTIIVWTDLVPVSLEYSAKDDKFRLQAIAERKQVTLNLGRIISVEAGEAVEHIKTLKKGKLAKQTLVLEIEDERSTMVRALMHFSDLAKETEKLDESHYLLTVRYDKGDETEMLFRVLSFGPTVKVREPEDFKELIRKKLREQMQCSAEF